MMNHPPASYERSPSNARAEMFKTSKGEHPSISPSEPKSHQAILDSSVLPEEDAFKVETISTLVCLCNHT